MEEKYKSHVSELYLLCPTIPPRVLSNEQWWQVIKELSGLTHTVPMLEDSFRKASIIQLEYLIIQFLQSNPTVLALRWLMSLYSITNHYVKLSVGRLLEETMLILYRFTGTELQDLDLNNLKQHNIGIDSKLSETLQAETNSEQNTRYSNTNILDITDSPTREIQPSHVINSLYLVQTLLRLEILETRKHFPGLIKCLPQLQVHVDTSMRDAANECLLSILPLGVPGYSLSEYVLNSLFSGVKILLEFDDSLNLKRSLQSMSLILTQQQKLASVKKQEILQLIVNTSSSLASGHNNASKTSSLIESISCLLSVSTVSQFTSSKDNTQLYDCLHYLSGLSNIQFSSYGPGSFPIRGEYFRVIISASILKIIDLHTYNRTPSVPQLERVWSLLLEYLQTYFIRKHATENLQWLTSSHWVFLWTQILKKVLVLSLSCLQDAASPQSSGMGDTGMAIWTKFEQFLNPLAKISPRISLECTLGLVSSSKDANWIWKLNKRFFELFLGWVFHISLTENFEISTTSYLSGHISAILIEQYFFTSQDRRTDPLIIEGIESIIMSYISFTNENIRVGSTWTDNSDFFETLIHNSHFLIGLSNSCSNPLLTTAILSRVTDYLIDSPDILIFSDPAHSNEDLFLLNNIFLLIQNLLANTFHLTRASSNEARSEARRIASRLYFLVPIWKSILANHTIEKVVVLIGSLAESCERFQLILESREFESWTIFDDERENPVIFLFKDLKRWLALLWTTMESFHFYIQLTGSPDPDGNHQTEIAKLEKFLMKASFSIVECILPSIPFSWTKFIPESKNMFLSSEISHELGSILCSPSSSLEDVGEYLRNSSFSKDSINPLYGTKSGQEIPIFLQTIEKFTFPFIGDQNCFSRYIHLSALIISLKLSVYKQLNANLFSYINHPPISNRALFMLTSDISSDQILLLDLDIPIQVFTTPDPPSLENRETLCDNSTSVQVPNNDIFALLECTTFSSQEFNCPILHLGLLKSMKPYLFFPVILNQPLTASNKSLEIHFREESARLLSNIISESHFLDQNNIFAHETVKNMFRILFKKSIHVSEFWSSVISESHYYQREDSGMKIQNLFPNYNNLSPSLFLMALKDLVSTPNDVSVTCLISIIWVFKDISKKVINKLDTFLLESGSQIDQDHLKLINNSQDLLLFIFSFLIKFLFGYRYRDLKQQINYQSQANHKKLPPRVKSCIVRYYVLSFLAYLLHYLHHNRSIFSHYYYAKQKLEHLITWGNYSLSRTSRSTEDSESLSDLYVFFSLLKPRISNMDTDLSGLIDTFFKDHANGSISERSKFFIYRVRRGIRLQNTLIETEADQHFGLKVLQTRSQLSLGNLSILDYFGECLCFNSLRELLNIGIFNACVETVHDYLDLTLKRPDRLLDYSGFNTIICVSLSLMFQVRLHEIPFIEHHSLFLWKSILRFYCSLDILGSANTSREISLRELPNTQLILRSMPYLNLIGLLITSSVYILRKTKIIEGLSSSDYGLLLIQEENLVPTLIQCILKTHLVEGNMSLSLLGDALQDMNVHKIHSLLAKSIGYLCKSLETVEINHSRNIYEISSFLLDDTSQFNLSPFLLFVQFKPSSQKLKDASQIELSGNRPKPILGVNMTIILRILNKICEMIRTKLTQVNSFDSLLNQSMVSYSFCSHDREDLSVNKSNPPLLKKVIRLMFEILTSVLDAFEAHTVNTPYVELHFLQRILLILRSIVSISPEYSQNSLISDFSGTLNRLMDILMVSGFSAPSSDTTITILEFFVQIYSSLSAESKQRVWDIVIATTKSRLEQIPPLESLGSKLYLLFKLAEISRSERKSLFESNEQDLILICGETLNQVVSQSHLDSSLVRHFAYIGFFVANSVEDLHAKMEDCGVRRLFNMHSLQNIIQKLIQGKDTRETNEMLHFIPSLVSIWNSVNNSTEFTRVVAEILVYFYSSGSSTSRLSKSMFYLETVSCLEWLIGREDILFSGLRQNFSLNFETLAVEYFDQGPELAVGHGENQVPQLEREAQGLGVEALCEKPSLKALVGMIHLFPLGAFKITKDFGLGRQLVIGGTDARVVYLRVYQLLMELITKDGLGYGEVQEEMIVRLENNLLVLYREISSERSTLDSFEGEVIEKESYRLAVGNMRFLVRRGLFQVLISTHLAWIEDEIKESLADLGGNCPNLDYYGHLIDMMCDVLGEIRQLGEDRREEAEETTRFIFKLLKYPLYCQIYSHPIYLDTFKRFILENEFSGEQENGPIPEMSGILRHHRRLEIMVLNKLGKLVEESSQYNEIIFDLLVVSLLPLSYSYSLEYGDTGSLLNRRPVKSWEIVRSIVQSESKERRPVSRERERSGLICRIEAFLKRYLEVSRKLRGGSLSIVLTPCPVIGWFQALFEIEGGRIVEEIDKVKVEDGFSRWIRLGEFYLPREYQQISMELLPTESSIKEEASIASIDQVEKEIVEILGLID
ncbi:hypothetical protein OJ253_1855 [Cryptosporidium canis]|uniref:Uncharacterized protein n=1 Tax=Cryptosporidium canis TaxID=195482 RepID=A0A9D5DGN5_9CRYT|nr:hypothetical protein OJ253_1855 [Cryptosporidium canis]